MTTNEMAQKGFNTGFRDADGNELHVGDYVRVCGDIGEVDVTFGVNSGTWAMTPKECVTAIKEVMKDRPIQVEQSCRTGAVVFTTETKTKEEKRQEVLAKLSPEERQILGLEEPKQ